MGLRWIICWSKVVPQNSRGSLPALKLHLSCKLMQLCRPVCVMYYLKYMPEVRALIAPGSNILHL